MSNEELAATIQEGHTELISQLWENTEKLFIMLCNKWWAVRGERFVQCGLSFDDLMQECYFVLIDATAAYDSGSGYRFTTYIHYPMQNRFNALLGYRRGHRRPLNDCRTLNSTETEDEEFELLDIIPDPDSKKPFEQVEHADFISRLHVDLDAAMQRKLNEQQRNVIYDFYYAAVPKSEIADRYGITSDRVKTILQTSRSRLRSDLVLRQRYRNEILQDSLYKGTGLNAFRYSGVSAVEKTFEILEKRDAAMKRRLRKTEATQD